MTFFFRGAYIKIFLWVLLAATIIGGLVGGEMTNKSFSITGATVGGIGTGAVLLGLGAYFSSQEEKNKKSDELSPEIRGVFDRMITGKSNPTKAEIAAAKQRHLKAAQSQTAKPTHPQKTKPADADTRPDFSIEGAIKSLMQQDHETMARGEIPETRLIPHHAIKRDLIIAAYTKDFKVSLDQVKNMDWTQNYIAERTRDLQKDFDKHIYGVKRLSWMELDKIIALMKETRRDFNQLEAEIRVKNPIYKIVEPL